MKYLLIALALTTLSSSSFAAYICRVKGTQTTIGLADREGGRTDIYIQGSGYYPITSRRANKFYSIGHGKRVVIDFANKTFEFGTEKYTLTGCRAAGE